MPLAERHGCWNRERAVSFCDVGVFVNLVAGDEVMPEGQLYRGGTIQCITSLAAIGTPNTIINPKSTPDSLFTSAAIHKLNRPGVAGNRIP